MKTAKNLEFLVDDEDVPFLSQFVWNIRQANYAQSSHFGRSVFVHRLVLGMDHTDKRVVDHINGNPLDNRKCNLRPCSIKENVRNRPKSKLNTSGFKGVFRCGRNYVSRITVDSVNLHLGLYRTAREAAEAYDVAAIKHFKEFSWLNFPGEKYDDPSYASPAKIHSYERYITRKLKGTSTTGLKNIYFMNGQKHYRVRIMIKGKRYVIGSFKDLSVAILARDNFCNDPNGPYQELLKSMNESA